MILIHPLGFKGGDAIVPGVIGFILVSGGKVACAFFAANDVEFVDGPYLFHVEHDGIVAWAGPKTENLIALTSTGVIQIENGPCDIVKFTNLLTTEHDALIARSPRAIIETRPRVTFGCNNGIRV